ncbi:hypothetical protein SHIRM173S_09204 [Streptomyces hirsutus]
MAGDGSSIHATPFAVLEKHRLIRITTALRHRWPGHHGHGRRKAGAGHPAARTDALSITGQGTRTQQAGREAPMSSLRPDEASCPVISHALHTQR